MGLGDWHPEYIYHHGPLIDMTPQPGPLTSSLPRFLVPLLSRMCGGGGGGGGRKRKALSGHDGRPGVPRSSQAAARHLGETQ